MQRYLYMEDRGESQENQRWATPKTPAKKQKELAKRAGIMPRSLIALDKAALGVAEDWRDRISLKSVKRKEESSVRVVARFRPASQEELEAESPDCERAFRVGSGGRGVESIEGGHSWEFDVAFDEGCSQEAVYNAAGHPVIDGLLDGYNGTIFAYGQTGSGKTHCMFGPHEQMYQTPDSRGIVPRAAQHIFDRIREGSDGAEFVLRCSLFEVYREQLRDLLDPANPNLRIKETPRQGVFVDGLAQEFVACEDDVVRLLRAGSRLRAVAATRLNQNSSRSHVIFSLTCEQRLGDGTEKLAKLNLVDLAGSEKVWKSSSSGVTLEEAKKINLSLSALGNVISALASRKVHVPYRNSKLTRILQETLGGNFKTALIVTCAPLRMHFDETISSLHFATRAKSVCNHIKVNFVYSAEQLMAFVERLQQELLVTRCEIAKHHGGTMPTSLPDALTVARASADAQFQWDASLLDETCGRPTPTPKKLNKHARIARMTQEIMPVLLRSLKLQEKLSGDFQEVLGAGLAHELRPPSALGLCHDSRSAFGTPSEQVSWDVLLVQQASLHKLLHMRDLSQQVASQQRNVQLLEGQRRVMDTHCNALKSLQDQKSSEQQSAHEVLGEHQPSASLSRPNSPRERRKSAGRDLAGNLRCDVAVAIAAAQPQSAWPSPTFPTWPRAAGEAPSKSTSGDVMNDRSSPRWNHAEHGSPVTACMDGADAPSWGDNDVEALRQELEMQRVDGERQEAMRNMIDTQTEHEQQQWYAQSAAQHNDFDHFEEQRLHEEQRLTELLEKRRQELSKTRQRVADRTLETVQKKHELLIRDRDLEVQRAADARATSAEDDRVRTQRQEVDDSICRLKAKRAALQEGTDDRGSWRVENGMPSMQAVGGA